MMDVIQKIKKCLDFPEAYKCFEMIEPKGLSTRQVTVLSRVLEQFTDPPDLKIAYLSNFTIDLLPSYVKVYTAKEKIMSSYYLSPYNQYFQDVLVEKSGLHRFEPNIVFLSLSLNLLAPEAVNSFSTITYKEKIAVIYRVIAHYEEWIAHALNLPGATILLTNFPLPTYPQNGIADCNDDFGEALFYFELNKKLSETARKHPRVNIFNLAWLSARFGSDNIFDSKLYLMAKILWKEQFLPIIANEILKFVIADKGLTRKCLVLDLDNTLWGGVVGEDGLNGIKVGQGDPISEAYFDFQIKIKSLKNRGILLAICSKNNESDIMEVFEYRKEMPLKLNDFSAYQINWDHKHLNIAVLAEELNIGMDSMVFMDDNPVECELVRQMLPQVNVYQIPSAPEKIPGMVTDLLEFEKVNILEEDKNKTKQYLQSKERKQLNENTGDLNQYLKSLATKVSIRAAHNNDLDRVHQLFVKTNQFNVTTKRYSIGEIEFRHKSQCHELIVISAQDKFGDLGIIGVCLLDIADREANIDSFILSCRAMGRCIEDAIMNHIKTFCFTILKKKIIGATYSPTAKNIPVRKFYDDQGFDNVDTLKNGRKYYQLFSKRWSLADCSSIFIQDEGEKNE